MQISVHDTQNKIEKCIEKQFPVYVSPYWLKWPDKINKLKKGRYLRCK